ncbi:MAG: hypothetical protein M3Y91_04665 [Actinomycetota bacterium]|nr:hypothetical protein [Actinomycetota bacterium]
MSTDDPGWGGYTPRPDEQTRRQNAAPPPIGPSGPGRKGIDPRILVGGGVIAVIAVIAVILILVTSSGSNSTTTTTAVAQTTIAPASSVAPSSTPTPTTASGPPTISKSAYITQADNICLAFRPKLQQAQAAGNIQVLTQVGQAEVDQLRNLPDPNQDVNLIRTFINEATQAVNFLNQSDIPDFNTAALADDTAAGQFGMKVCNYGH